MLTIAILQKVRFYQVALAKMAEMRGFRPRPYQEKVVKNLKKRSFLLVNRLEYPVFVKKLKNMGIGRNQAAWGEFRPPLSRYDTEAPGQTSFIRRKLQVLR